MTTRLHSWLVLIPLAAIPLFGVLRTFHQQTPRIPGLGPFWGSLLLWAALGLLALHLVQRRRGEDIMPDIERGPGLSVGMIVPLLVVVVIEKWVSADVLPVMFGLLPSWGPTPKLADAAYRLAGGLALGLVALAVYRVPRQVARKLEQRTLLSRVPSAVGLVLASAVATGLLFAGLPSLLGGLQLAVAGPDTRTWSLMAAAQVVRGASEELFFRGLLQTTLLRLLWQAGLPEGRLARVIAIGTVSLGFTIEHIDPAQPLARQASLLLWVLAMSCVFGVLLESSRNLFLAMGAHAMVNLLVGGLLPVPVTAEGTLAVPAGVPATIFVMLLFVGIVVMHRRRGFA